MSDKRPSIEEWRAQRVEHAALYRAAGDSAAAGTITDLLLEIAAAGLKLDAAERALMAAKDAGRSHERELREAAACLAEHDAALAKVRP